MTDQEICDKCGERMDECDCPKSEWISINDQLPEDGKWVLGLFEGFFITSDPITRKPSNQIFETCFLRKWGWNRLLCPDKDAYITHWMPLPEPPHD